MVTCRHFCLGVEWDGGVDNDAATLGATPAITVSFRSASCVSFRRAKGDERANASSAADCHGVLSRSETRLRESLR